MTSNFKLTLLSGVAAAAATMMAASAANASYGMLPHCVGTVKCGMGGAGSAKAGAAVDAAMNPALSAHMGNEYQVNLGWFWADVEGQTMVTNANFAVSREQGTKQTSSADSFPNGSIGVNYKLDDVRTLNISIVPGGGGASKWAESRTANLIGANNSVNDDQEITYEMVYLQPSMSWKVSDTASYGIGAILSHATIKTDSIYGQFEVTDNPNKKETFYGAGFQLGGVWQVDAASNASVAVNYRSPVWHGDTGNYKGKVFAAPIDTPQQVTAGVAFDPMEGTTFAMDYKFVNWSASATIGNWPDGAAGTESAGFGWVDQHILMFGVEQEIDPSTRVRIGYSYGNSPIEENNVFANFLFPAIIEHHITLGGEFDIDDRSSVGFSAYVTPKASVTDDGTGGTYSGMGSGTSLTHQQYGFQLSYEGSF